MERTYLDVVFRPQFGPHGDGGDTHGTAVLIHPVRERTQEAKGAALCVAACNRGDVSLCWLPRDNQQQYTS